MFLNASKHCSSDDISLNIVQFDMSIGSGHVPNSWGGGRKSLSPAMKCSGLWNTSSTKVSYGSQPHKDTTVYQTIWFKEQTQCVEWFGFSGPLEPTNKGLLYWELQCVKGYRFKECLRWQEDSHWMTGWGRQGGQRVPGIWSPYQGAFKQA